MAQACKRLYPDVKLAIGPSIDTGFYYDFDTERPFSIEELDKIENEMKKIVKEIYLLKDLLFQEKKPLSLWRKKAGCIKLN